MFDLRGSDPERERPERAVRRGVAVAADDRHSRLRTPLLGSDNMDDPAARIAHREILDPETARIFDQCFELRARLAIGNPGGARRLSRSRAIMIGQPHPPPGPPPHPPPPPQTPQSRRPGPPPPHLP